MAPTLAAVGCEMLRFETGEAVERSPRNRMLVRQSTVVNFLGERDCCSRGEYSTKGSQYRATPRISLPRRDSFFAQTKSCLSGSVHETFPDTIVDEFAGFSFAVDSMWTRTLLYAQVDYFRMPVT